MSHPSPHPSDDHLVDLECDLLEPALRARTVAHLIGCAECERRFREVHGDAERVTLRRPPRIDGGSVGSRRWMKWASAAAVLLVSLLGARELSRRLGSDGLDYWLPLESEGILIRAAPVPQDGSRYHDAVDAYARRDVRRVVGLLSDRPIPQAYEPLNLLLASALVWEGRHAEARAVLEQLDIETLPQPARDRAHWILYVALRRDGRVSEAREVARTLAASPGEFSDRARAQLE